MLRSAVASARRSRVGFFDRLWRYSRAVEVDVFDWGLVVDNFRASDPTTLKDAILPVYRHSKEARGAVRLVGIEERSLPFGLLQTRREVTLDDLTKAVCFLES